MMYSLAGRREACAAVVIHMMIYDLYHLSALPHCKQSIRKMTGMLFPKRIASQIMAVTILVTFFMRGGGGSSLLSKKCTGLSLTRCLL